MEAKVPQRIDMEDKIVGPLTLTQFFYVLFGGLIIYVVNSWIGGTVIGFLIYPFAFLVGLFSLALAFVRIQERPFIYFVLSFFRFASRPQRRIWIKGSRSTNVQIVQKAASKDQSKERKPLDMGRLKQDVSAVDRPFELPASATQPPGATNGR